MAGSVGEHSGTINIAIEGQLLLGAFLGAVVASLAGSAWVGLVAAPLAGVLVSLGLVLFGLKYRVDQIIVGVVLNVLVLGLTNFFYSTVLNASKESRAALNSGVSLPAIDIPILSRIPLIGPVLFRQTILVYIMYVVVIVLQYMMFHSRWGLRMRACGEHPKAADTVGINVFRTRVNNAILGGALAGLGGAFFTIGHGLAFTKDMASGNGYIALAAMILGGWSPIGGVAAALLFGFAMNLGYTLSIIGSPMPSQIVLMILGRRAWDRPGRGGPEGEANIYVCGPTVYNFFHLGNARPLVVFDCLRRYLEYIGYKVNFVQNFTDVDDKIINKAREEGRRQIGRASCRERV